MSQDHSQACKSRRANAKKSKVVLRFFIAGENAFLPHLRRNLKFTFMPVCANIILEE